MALRRAERPATLPFDPALRKRVVSAMLLAALAVGEVLLGGWFFTFLLLAAIVLMAIEWRRLAGPLPRVTGEFMTAVTASVPVMAVAGTTSGAVGEGLAWLCGGAVLAAGIAALLPGGRVDRTAAGILYLGLPMISLVWLRADADTGMQAVLWLLFVVWATDTFAYFAGRALGGPRLAPRISPSKTWAGLLGGIIGASVVGAGFTAIKGGSVPVAAVVAVVLAMTAQAGDLFESWLKRQACLKDSGAVIPGHGGMLDRVDGLLFAAPAFAALILLFGAGLVS